MSPVTPNQPPLLFLNIHVVSLVRPGECLRDLTQTGLQRKFIGKLSGARGELGEDPKL